MKIPDRITPAARKMLSEVRAHIAATHLPRYLFDHDHDVREMERIAAKYGFTFDVKDGDSRDLGQSPS